MPVHSKVIVAHDYLTQRGGAERVVLALSSAFPSAPIVTALYDPERTYPDFRTRTVVTSALQRSSWIRSDHRRGLPLYAGIFGNTNIIADLAICSTSGWAHGVDCSGRTLLYVHNTARWLYQRDEYQQGLSTSLQGATRPALWSLRKWDRKHSRSADCVLVNSNVVRDRVRQHWGIDSEVLYPPYCVDPGAQQEPVEGLQSGYLLAVSRLISYKRIEILLAAMKLLPQHQLVVVGDGPLGNRLRTSAPSNCRFLGSVSDSSLRWLYANCLALISAASEDLGLTPIEAMAFGKPAAVLRDRGYMETVIEGQTGVFFDTPAPDAVARAIVELTVNRWNHALIAEYADRFSQEHFILRLTEIASALLK